MSYYGVFMEHSSQNYEMYIIRRKKSAHKNGRRVCISSRVFRFVTVVLIFRICVQYHTSSPQHIGFLEIGDACTIIPKLSSRFCWLSNLTSHWHAINVKIMKVPPNPGKITQMPTISLYTHNWVPCFHVKDIMQSIQSYNVVIRMVENLCRVFQAHEKEICKFNFLMIFNKGWTSFTW